MWESATSARSYGRAYALYQADRLYRDVRVRAWLAKTWATLTGRPSSLLDLAAVQTACQVRSRHWDGVRTVPIRHIRGSEGRSHDFDSSFRPIRTHNRRRWVNIAAAREMRATLPPIELIQVGEIYFVRDGHHRVSVARAMGQEHIEAEVTLWRTEGPPPWERTAMASRPLHVISRVALQPA
jgi:hypothetical protein